MGVAIIICLFVLFFAWTICIENGMFATEEQKAVIAKRKARDKRWVLFREGKMPYEDMSWSEKIHYCYHHPSHRKHLWDMIFDSQDAIVNLRNDQENEEYVTDHLVDECVSHWITEEWRRLQQLDDHALFAIRYARIIDKYTLTRNYESVLRTCPAAQRLQLCEECLQKSKSDEMRKWYLQMIDSEKREIAHEEAVKRENKRRSDLETRGGYAGVQSGSDYEVFVAFCLKEAGVEVTRVGQSGDYGADVIAECGGGIRVVVQCKFYSSAVGYDAIKEVYAAKAIYKGTHAWVVSNADFTEQAKKAAKNLGVKLLSHEYIDREIRRLKNK